jgi:hypothetical protein
MTQAVPGPRMCDSTGTPDRDPWHEQSSLPVQRQVPTQ